MKYFKTERKAFLYGKRMCTPDGRAFLVAQVESGRWKGYWFASTV